MDFYRIYEIGRNRRTTIFFGSIGAGILISVIVIAALGDQLRQSNAALKVCSKNQKTNVTGNVTVPAVAALVKNGTSNSTDDICITPTCVLAAAQLIRSMDTNVDPCEDFYQFACGGWFKKNPIQPYRFRSNQTTLLDDQLTDAVKALLMSPPVGDESRAFGIARGMYATCVDTVKIDSMGLTPLTDLLNLFGGWPMTMDSWDSSSFDWTVASAAAKRMFGLNIFLSVNTELDLQNTSRSVIYVDQGSLGLPRSILINSDDGQNIATISAYTNFIVGSAKAVRNFMGSSVSNLMMGSRVNDMLQFEMKLAKITSSDELRYNQTRMFNPMPLSKLQNETDSFFNVSPRGQIDWSAYLNSIYNTSAGIVIDSSERVVVAEKPYVKDLLDLLDSTPNRVLANYFHWRLVMELGRETIQNMTDLSFTFAKAVYGVAEPEYRSRKCANQINRLLGFAISSKYVQANFDDNSKAEMRDMVTNLKTSLKGLLVAAAWMDLPTTLEAITKVQAINTFIGYPDWIVNRTLLESYYNDLKYSRDSHFENVKNARSFLVAKNLKKLRKNTARNEWSTSPTSTRSFYSSKINGLNFPVAALQLPFYMNGRPAALNYGAIGAIISREMVHSIDDQGRQFDKDGNLKRWWTRQTLEQFFTQTKCFMDQYSIYEPPRLPGNQVNGVLTLSENIADNGGLAAAFRAYEDNVQQDSRLPGLEQFRPEQLFFLSFANNFCGVQTIQSLRRDLMSNRNSPLRFRVIGSLSNSDDFVKNFKCSAGSYMNRNRKCSVW